MEFEFTAEIWHWRGPSPDHFVSIPPEQAEEIHCLAEGVTYGWGMIPVRARVGGATWKTSMFPKDGGYLLPLRDSVRRSEGLVLGDVISVQVAVLGA